MSQPCREWKGTFWNHGYGYIYWAGRDDLAHRVIYEIVNGSYNNKLQVLHHCDNPKCVNPTHLYLGNNARNVQDREDRKRAGRWWETTDAQKRQIKELKGKMTQAKIAKIVGCSVATVQRWS